MIRFSLYKFIIGTAFLLSAFTLNAQVQNPTDSFTKKTLEELVITATRTKKSIGNIPVPVQVISKSFIQQTGSQKLIDILQQQTGLVVVDNPLGQALQGYPNPFGSGIQLQGLDPAYTLILLDGEPLIGRNAGILNLGRIAVGNIKQIEVVKGPATSLYGSDALAGVINIITETPKTTTGNLQIHHATNNTWGLTANAFIQKNRSKFQLFVNRYSSSGYDLDKSIYGKTADPYRNYSFAAKWCYEISKRAQFQTSSRIFTQKQFNNYLVYTGSQPEIVNGTSNETDWNINNQFNYTFSKKFKLISRLYLTGYKNNSEVFLASDKKIFDRSFLQQFLVKPEIQIEAGKKEDQKFIAGIGYNYETMDANRYTKAHTFNAAYFYAQKEWLLNNTFNITAGARIDKHTLYKTQFNPKLAVSYKFFNRLTLYASIGTGFKAPDFRQQFLNFNNALVGYTIFGANELSNGLLSLKQQGQIDASVDLTPYLGNNALLPENSVGINVGWRLIAHKKLILTSNFFRNDISNLIDNYSLPFTKLNNQSIFSYRNINRVFTQGFDINFSYTLNRQFALSGGYQYLDAKDKDIIEKIREQKLVKRDPLTFVSSYVTKNEYGGLFNRSRHTANLQFSYSNKKNNLSTSIRANYRGRFGFRDLNGSGVLDDNSEYVNGYILLNASITKTFKKGIELQAGSDNILDHKDKDRMPGMYGRTFFVNCNINFKQLLNKKTNDQ